jgi:hypothetical protein
MAGELCCSGCGWCGRCDAEPEDRCDCGWFNCLGDCEESIEASPEGRSDDTGDARELVQS